MPTHIDTLTHMRWHLKNLLTSIEFESKKIHSYGNNVSSKEENRGGNKSCIQACEQQICDSSHKIVLMWIIKFRSANDGRSNFKFNDLASKKQKNSLIDFRQQHCNRPLVVLWGEKNFRTTLHTLTKPFAQTQISSRVSRLRVYLSRQQKRSCSYTKYQLIDLSAHEVNKRSFHYRTIVHGVFVERTDTHKK